jgi:enediyne biosynthesis protein E4
MQSRGSPLALIRTLIHTRSRSRARNGQSPWGLEKAALSRKKGIGMLLCGLFLAYGCGDEARVAPGPELRVGAEETAETSSSRRAQRDQLDATVWRKEGLAQEYEKSLVSLWDDLLAAGRLGEPAAKFQVLANLEPAEVILGTPRSPTSLDHGIERSEFGPPLRSLGPSQWRALLDELAESGYLLVQSEWHHARFEPATGPIPARSRVAVVLHGIHAPTGRRFAVEGPIEVEWAENWDRNGLARPLKVDASGLRMLNRGDSPAFERVGVFPRETTNPALAGGLGPGSGGAGASRLHPLVLYDLDGNGFDDLLLLGAGRVLRNRGGMQFEAESLFDHPQPLAEAGAVADFDGDGNPDLLAARTAGDTLLYLGDARGRFPHQPHLTPRLPNPLRGPSSLAVGDIDGDGDLDAWLAQYKPPYLEGQMPTPFFDANDGWPGYLFRNRGDGRFELATEEAGLAEKRFRRTYASTFVDLDEDADLDLLVISDFSGVDLYTNDGQGHFSDANSTLIGDRHLFGMSGALADYNLDGKTDIFVAGMGSTTARRLEAAGLHREDRPEESAMRMRMAYGNRMYLAGEGGWQEPDFHADVARTGWTWGTTALDFDNDGDPDIFAVNGHESGESTQDYCSTFWRHDIFDGDSKPDQMLENLFAEEGSGFSSGAESWDGYQKNHLLMNQAGRSFVNVAFLLGVGDEFDSRSALSSDLDKDGRVDLVVIEQPPGAGEQLHIYRNTLPQLNNWIGVEFSEDGAGPSPVGARALLRAGGRSQVRQVMVGESIMGQHSTTLHFGLGPMEKVDSIEVHWPGGKTRTLLNPGINRYHRVAAGEPPPSP